MIQPRDIKKTKTRGSISQVEEGNEMQENPSPRKKRKMSKCDDTFKKDEKSKIGNPLGSIIGRKRKEPKKHTKGT